MHFATPGHKLLVVGLTASRMEVVERGNAVLVALQKYFAHLFRRVPFAHDPVQNAVEMPIAVQLVAAHDQAAYLHITELHLRHFNLRIRH